MKKLNKKIPVAIIGAGRIGMLLEKDLKRVKPATHFGMWLNNNRTNLVAICDIDKKKLKFARKRKKNIKFFENPKEMILKTKPKIVSISTWKDTHYKICKLCISMGLKVIILEKPLTNSIGQAKKINKNYKKK
jgi:predicted dehydrogenase